MRSLWQWVLVVDLNLNQDCLARLEGSRHLLIGFSGGLDSTVLLHKLASTPQLFDKIIAVHVNHGLSGNALHWEAHCQAICQALAVPLVLKRASLDCISNIEEEARKARYTIFLSLVKDGDSLILGHHRDDQAETLLLQLFRGAGLDGLAAMAPVKPFGLGELFRPLLEFSRKSLESYADSHGLVWINDESNADCKLSRNFLRHEVIPLLQTRWPGVVKNLSRTASHCFNAHKLLSELAIIDYPDINQAVSTLSIAMLDGLSELRVNNVLRAWFKGNAIRFPDTATFQRIIPEVIFASAKSNPEISWGDYRLCRYQQNLYLFNQVEEELPKPLDWDTFPLSITLNAGIGTLTALAKDNGLQIPAQSRIQVRFRTGGESLRWHGQTKSLKKLFQDWAVPGWVRGRIPLIYINNQLAAIVGYAISDLFYQSKGENVYQVNLEKN